MTISRQLLFRLLPVLLLIVTWLCFGIAIIYLLFYYLGTWGYVAAIATGLVLVCLNS